MMSPAHKLLSAIVVMVVISIAAHGQEADEPMWVAITKAQCGKYRAVLWGGVEGAQSFWRFYDLKPTERNRKRIKEIEANDRPP